MAERMVERDAAAAAALADRDAATVTKLQSLMKSLSASVDIKTQHLSDTMDGKMASLNNTGCRSAGKRLKTKWSKKVVHPERQGSSNL